jgi:hypothetical protein
MKIAAVCCTWCRPERLSYLIRCFELQDHPDCELVILDDAGQYHTQEGHRWKLVSVQDRYPTLGEKRNAASLLISAETEAMAILDDDDLYLPWALSAIDAALRDADWAHPSLVLGLRPDKGYTPCPTTGLYLGSCGYRRALFERVGGYPAMNSGEDQALAHRFNETGARCSDPIALGYKPYHVYWWADMWHISAYDDTGYDEVGKFPRPFVGTITPMDPPGINIRHPEIEP